MQSDEELEYRKKYGTVCPDCGGTGKRSTVTFRKVAMPIYIVIIILAIISVILSGISKIW